MKIRERERVEEQPDKRVRATTIEYGEIPKERIKSGIRPDPSRSDPSSFREVGTEETAPGDGCRCK